MKLLCLTAVFLAAAQAVPRPQRLPIGNSLSPGFSEAEVDALLRAREAESHSTVYAELERRKGGGGGGHGSGGGKSGSSGGSSSGGSSSGGSSSSGSSSSGGSKSGTTSSTPSFGGGKTYAGGSSSSYVAGSRSPSGITPSLVAGGALGFAAGSLWMYPFHTRYYYDNSSTHQNQSLPVECVCDQNDPCGCDDTGSTSDINEMLQNSTVAKVENVNGTSTVVINGTLLSSSAAGPALFVKGAGALSTWWAATLIVGTAMCAL